MQTIVLTVEEFRKILDERLEAAFTRFRVDAQPNQDNLVSRKDIARLFGVSLVTVNTWMKEGLLPYHRINRRVYFKKSEVMASLEAVNKYRKK